MSVLIKIIGLGDGSPSVFDGQFVSEYDPAREGFSPDGRRMLCHLTTTADPERAAQFSDWSAALEMWRRSHGMRADGRPNRPLTAFTVEIVPSPGANIVGS